MTKVGFQNDKIISYDRKMENLTGTRSGSDKAIKLVFGLLEYRKFYFILKDTNA